VARDSSLPAIKLHKRVSEDLDALAEIERNYEKEIRAVFGVSNRARSNSNARSGTAMSPT
jgi:hypothetical protein